MDRGMILDTAHMSDKSVAGTFATIGRKLQRDYPRCAGFPASTACDSLAYPAIISHAHFRGLARYGAKDFLPSEYDISDSNLELVRRVGGVVGPFVTEDRVSTSRAPGGTYPENDCAMSSKSFAYSYRYAAQRLGRYGVGMATDFTLIPGVSPRFGKDACWGYNLARDPDDELKNYSKYYNKKAQRNPVVYRQEGTPSESALESYRLGAHTYDYNTEGLAHFGLVPDMLQDLKNVGMPEEDRALLFRSAEDYIRMWERASRLAH
jgi:microsomal dipeptidase-like Zn-dependent dipeptidase